MKMDVALFLLAFALFWKSSQGIKCYKCIPERVAYETTPICQDFDASSKFVVDCDSSTMCFKRTTSLHIGNEMTVTEQRGCALQTQNGEQKKINGKWVAVQDIHEVYEESCIEKTDDDQRPTKTAECYCRADMCNAAVKNVHTVYFMLIPIFSYFCTFLVE